MSNRNIRFIIFLASIVIIGVTVTQIYWVRQAFQLERREFQRNVNLALLNMADNFYEATDIPVPTISPIIKLSETSYMIMINGHLDANLVEILLKRSFSNHNLYTDFQYSIYKNSTNEVVFHKDVPASPGELLEPDTTLPVFNDTNYYFGVKFPAHTSLLFNRMQIWIYSSVIILAVFLFFAYALFVILKQKRLSEIQKDFINNMTHEFKTPISTIEIASEVLKDHKITDQPERLLKYATIIENENQRLKNQVDKVLQIASLDKGMIELKRELLDMHKLLSDAIDQVRSALPDNSISTKLDASEIMVKADKVHITNVIYNLLDNAIKYSQANPEILVETNSSENSFTMSFKDNGIGIPAEHQKNIFSKFYRVPTGNVHNAKGFGIGLHYVRLIIEAHSGSVSLESESGKGSTFNVTLPI